VGDQLGLPQAASSAQGCLPEELAREGAQGSGSVRTHSTLPLSDGESDWGGGILCPVPTADLPGSGSWHGKAASSVAPGL
jgi:hypothetical protein